MAKAPSIENLLKSGSTEWNKLRKAGKVPVDHTGATFPHLFSANADLSGLTLVGSEWEKCDLSKMNFRETDLSNAYFHGGRLQDCDFRGANLEGATFEKLKLLRCDFTGCLGLESVEFDDVDMDRVTGLDGEAAPPPPPPPAHGITSFTREQRTAAEQAAQDKLASELPPFRPQDAAGTLLFRGLSRMPVLPAWVLDVVGQRPPLPPQGATGGSLESLARDAARTRFEGRKPNPDPETVKKAQQALRMGSKDAPHAALYLRDVNVDAEFRFSASQALRTALRSEIDVDDLTGAVDPRVTGALLTLQLPNGTGEALGEAKRRLAATQLFTSLLEAGFHPENNWEEAVDATEAAQDLAQMATSGDRPALSEAFNSFAALPEEARLRRLGYLAEAVSHLEELSRLPPGVEPQWLQGPESRECDNREMQFVQALSADEIPQKVAALAKTELGVPEGEIPEDSDQDLFVHLRCPVCGKEKLVVQTRD